MKSIIKLIGILMLFFVLSGWLMAQAVQAEDYNQQPTVSIPTVTGTPQGPTVIVNTDQDQINVRSGPNTTYPKVGVLIAGQELPALGRSPGGDWIQIAYSGVPEGVAWVYAFLVSPPSGTLPVVAPPPTPTPRVTPTIDPTLAAEFNVIATATRLPTFTPPPPLILPTFESDNDFAQNPVPPGMLIIGFIVLGGFGGAISFLRRR